MRVINIVIKKETLLTASFFYVCFYIGLEIWKVRLQVSWETPTTKSSLTRISSFFNEGGNVCLFLFWKIYI